MGLPSKCVAVVTGDMEMTISVNPKTNGMLTTSDVRFYNLSYVCRCEPLFLESETKIGPVNVGKTDSNTWVVTGSVRFRCVHQNCDRLAGINADGSECEGGSMLPEVRESLAFLSVPNWKWFHGAPVSTPAGLKQCLTEIGADGPDAMGDDISNSLYLGALLKCLEKFYKRGGSRGAKKGKEVVEDFFQKMIERLLEEGPRSLGAMNAMIGDLTHCDGSNLPPQDGGGAINN